jgi:predicted permease
MLANPLPWAIVLGGVASATGCALPAPLMRSVSMLADAASPTALFTIGAVLARSQLRAAASGRARHRWGDVPVLVACKLVVHPALMLALGSVAIAAGARLSRFSLHVLVLVAALPSASNVPMLAERFGADTARIARIVLITTALAFVSFSAAVALIL